MNTIPKGMGSAELAIRVNACPKAGAWFAWLTPKLWQNRATEALSRELEAMNPAPVLQLAAQGDALDLAHRVRAAAKDATLILVEFEDFSKEAWAALDRLRSWFSREEPAILILSQGAFEQLMQSAPNFASWLGGSVWSWNAEADVLSGEEKEQYLQSLRNHFGLSDGQVIKMAEKDELPLEPEFAQWLVLLERGDLLGHGA